jgi:hypothetical protein
MANVKITDLTAYTDPLNTDVLAIVDVTNNVTKKVSIANMAKNVSLGTEALPGVAFDGDPNTGIYSPGADQVAISTNGTGRLFVTSGGLVGVGATPTAKFESYFSSTNPSLSSNTGAGLSVNGTSTVRLNFGNYPGSPYSSWVQSSDGAGASFPLVLNPLGGNVGIGTTAPANALQVVSGSNYVASFNTSTTSASSSAVVIGSYLNAGGGTNGGAIRVYHNHGLTVATSMAFEINGATEAARIDSSGRLLVGTSSSPSVGDSLYSYLVVQGYPGGSTGNANISLQRGETAANITSGEQIGDINFTDSAGYSFAKISCLADANAGSNDYPGRLVFSTTADGAASPTERLRINNVGQILMGTTSTTGLATGSSANQGVYFAAGVSFFQCNNNANHYWSKATGYTSGDFTAHWVNNNYVGGITTNGSTTSYVTASDYRLKENVVPLTGAIDRINDLQVYRFNFIANPGHTVDGFIAHEAQLVVPECATKTKDAVDEDGKPVMQGIDQSKLVPLLTAALQEAIARIEALETRLSALEAA